MARRIKEEPSVHRTRIARAAGRLFEEKGIEGTSMNEISAEAGYSKATLYVYFQNKDEIVGYLVLTSMIKLKEYLTNALQSNKSFQEKYMDICNAMVLYEEEFPFYFSLVLDYINIDFENSKCEESERNTFLAGEEINEMLLSFFVNGIEHGVFKKPSDVKAVIFSLWGMLSGVIQLASKKQVYINYEMHMTKENFLEKGFTLLYDAIKK